MLTAKEKRQKTHKMNQIKGITMIIPLVGIVMLSAAFQLDRLIQSSNQGYSTSSPNHGNGAWAPLKKLSID